MASMGVAAGVEYAKTGKKVSGYTDTGVTLIAASRWPASTARTSKDRHRPVLGGASGCAALSRSGRSRPRLRPASFDAARAPAARRTRSPSDQPCTDMNKTSINLVTAHPPLGARPVHRAAAIACLFFATRRSASFAPEPR